MNRSQTLFWKYAEDRRESEIDGFRCDIFPHLTRYTPQIEGMEGLVVFAQLPDHEAVELIHNEIKYFSDLSLDIEWKVYDFDKPDDLMLRLKAEGFRCGESEAFMVYFIDRERKHHRYRSNADIRRVQNAEGLKDVAIIQQIVWNQDFSWLVKQLSNVLTNSPTELSLYCAYVDDEPVGCGWTGFPSQSNFPELHGGAVIPEHRGKSIYGDLYRIRCEEISQRGYSWTTVDATSMSRPILERLGFEYVCMTHPMRFQSP